jgi:hypothetical protein
VQVERLYDVDLGAETLREADTGIDRSIGVIRDIDGNIDGVDGAHVLLRWQSVRRIAVHFRCHRLREFRKE